MISETGQTTASAPAGVPSESHKIAPDTIAFLDTNVLLHFPQPDEIDWPKFLKADHVLIVVPFKVVQELDVHKGAHPYKKIRERATERTKWLLRVTDAANPVWIRDRTTLTVQHALAPDSVIRSGGFDPSQPDDQIIGAVLAQGQTASGRVVLVTGDTGIQLKARATKITCVALPETLRLQDPMDEADKRIKVLQEENARLRNVCPDPTLTFLDGEGFQKITIHPVSPVTRAEIEKEMSARRTEHPEAEKASPPPNQPDQPLASLFTAFGKSSDGPTSAEVDRYNSELADFFRKYEAFLVKKSRYREIQSRMFRIDFLVHNRGTAPAESVHLHLHIPDGVTVYAEKDLPDEPIPPQPPTKPRTQVEIMKSMLRFDIPLPPDLYRSSPLIESIDPSVPTIRRTNSYDIDFELGDINHHFQNGVHPLYLVYPERIFSFEIAWSIFAANAPALFEGTLHIIAEGNLPNPDHENV